MFLFNMGFCHNSNINFVSYKIRDLMALYKSIIIIIKSRATRHVSMSRGTGGFCSRDKIAAVTSVLLTFPLCRKFRWYDYGGFA